MVVAGPASIVAGAAEWVGEIGATADSLRLIASGALVRLGVFFSRVSESGRVSWGSEAFGSRIAASAVEMSARFSSSQILTMAISTNVRRCRTCRICTSA